MIEFYTFFVMDNFYLDTKFYDTLRSHQAKLQHLNLYLKGIIKIYSLR